jgi:hypothetical protein
MLNHNRIIDHLKLTFVADKPPAPEAKWLENLYPGVVH